MLGLPILFRAFLVAFVLMAAIYDIRFRRIPNWLNLSGLVLGFGLNLLFFQIHGAVTAVEGLLLATAIYLPMYMLRGMGAGDVKLMAAVGAIVGPSNWLIILLATGLAGGAGGAGYALLKRRLSETCCNLYFLIKDLVQLRAPHRTNPQLDFRNPASLRMPHGLIIALGCVAVLILDFANPKLLAHLVRWN